MSSALMTPFQGLDVTEVVPKAGDLTELRQSSVLQGRRRVRVQPQTGVNAGPNAILQFVISDSTGLIDPASMVISGSIAVTPPSNFDAGTEICQLDEGASVFRRGQILANGSLLEDVDNLHRASNLDVITSCEPGWYKSDGSFLNFWKFNETLSVAAATAQNNVEAHGVEMSEDLSGNGYQVAWPVGLVLPSMKGGRYLPLRNMGELVLMFTMAAATEAIWCNTAVPATQPTYAFNDIFLEYDIVIPHPSLAAMYDRICQMESEPGISIAFTSRLVAQGQSIPASAVAGSSGTLTESSVVTSRATTNLRKLIYANCLTDGLNALDYPSVSCFPDSGFSSFQVRVGSIYQPQQPANSLSRAFMLTSAAYGEPANVAKGSVFNRHNYDTTTLYSNGAVYKNVPSFPSGQFQGVLRAGAGERFPYSDFAPKALSFDSFKGGEELENDGISVLGQAKHDLGFFPKLALCF